MYDESISLRHEYPYWQTLANDGILMYISNEEVDHSQYKLSEKFDEDHLIPCKIIASDGDNST